MGMGVYVCYVERVYGGRGIERERVCVCVCVCYGEGPLEGRATYRESACNYICTVTGSVCE